jgi:hypothetical protein
MGFLAFQLVAFSLKICGSAPYAVHTSTNGIVKAHYPYRAFLADGFSLVSHPSTIFGAAYQVFRKEQVGISRTAHSAWHISNGFLKLYVFAF